MQKKLIALAVAGLVSGAAFAQSNVTVYGVADAYYAYAKGNNAGGQDSSHHINSGGLSGSRIGFKGTEDLGNGLKALFTLEYALSVDQNSGIGDIANGATQARQQFIGLTGNWGTAVAGRLQTAGYDWSCGSSSVAGSALDPQAKLGVGLALVCGSGTAGRANNAVAYISPSFSGFTFAYNHARVTENQGGNGGAFPLVDSDNYANLLSATYANGPISASLVWSKITGERGGAFAKDITEWGIRGAYDFGMVKLWGMYQDTSDDRTAYGDHDKWQVGVSAPISANGTIHAYYAANDIDKAPGTASLDSKSYSIAYTHSLSKRTTVYGGYNYVSNDRGATRASLVTPDAGDNSSTLAIGLRHSF
jgi:predicted porin